MHREALLYSVLAMLVLEGRDEFIMTPEFLDDRVWESLKFAIIRDPDADKFVIKLSLLGHNPIVRDAEFSIEEPATLPPELKQLLP